MSITSRRTATQLGTGLRRRRSEHDRQSFAAIVNAEAAERERAGGRHRHAAKAEDSEAELSKPEVQTGRQAATAWTQTLTQSKNTRGRSTVSGRLAAIGRVALPLLVLLIHEVWSGVGVQGQNPALRPLPGSSSWAAGLSSRLFRLFCFL
ncbi:hypothetical protein MHYP_G00328190 [Metynnis hypsauchen]